MTTPTPLQTEPTPPVPTLSPDAPAATTEKALERYGRLMSLQRGLRRARALDDADAPPQAGPRDLTGIYDALITAQNNKAYYYSHPDWHALRDIRQQVDGVLARLNEQAETTPQAAIHAAKITTLAASLIARHAAKVSAHLDAWDQRNTPGGRAMRTLTRVAEDHAARASGLDSVQALDTPRLLIAHVHKLNKELRRAEPSQELARDLSLDDPDDPALDSALSTGAATDPELAEASQLMSALSELAARARRAGHRLTLDVRLHGMIETAQLRGFEMISGIAQAVMRRYDNQGRGTEGRRTIAAMIYHYAEQRLERMRGSLGEDEHREHGYYEGETPDRYLDALFDESRTVLNELKAENLTPQEQTDLQIRFLLAQNAIAARVDEEYPMEANFPPKPWVAGLRTDTPVATRLALIDELRRRVENDPYHRDAPFLNRAKDRFAQEIAGPTELTAEAVDAEVTATEIRAIAQHLVEHGTVASPLVLSDTPELNVSHAQAERALDVLHRLKVVGPPNGLKPRETTATTRSLPDQLMLLEERLPNLLRLQEESAQLATSPAPPAAPPAPTPAQTQPSPSAEVTNDQLRRAALAAAANKVASPQMFASTLNVTPEQGQALMNALQERNLLTQAPDGAWEPQFDVQQVDALIPARTPTPQTAEPPHTAPTATVDTGPAPAATAPPDLPRRQRGVERPHPGNIAARHSKTPAADTTDAELEQLLSPSQDRIAAISKAIIDGAETRAAAHPAPAEATTSKPAHVDEAQQNAQQAQQTTGVGIS
ncbi:hypothetical protein [Streptomyces sp. 7N604]|uniref:hypothetical protein n=1 Tax=Streptomyces sp. 7N604 TaxID=3457415 RepID=UPI003FD27249